MNPIIKNLVHVIRRFRLATTLNILGLSVAFAAFMVIMIHLSYHFGFDRFHKDYDKIFRMELGHQTVISRPLAEAFIASSPHIIAGARKASWRGGGNTHFSVERDGVQHFFQEKIHRVTPEFTDVFTFDFVEGSGDALSTFRNVIIPLSISRRLFGNESAIGKHLTLGNGTVYTVVGVYRDFPSNSILRNDILTPFYYTQNIDGWGNWNYHTYIRVNDASNAPLIIENFNRIFTDGTITGIPGWFTWSEEAQAALTLRALPDIHFATELADDSAPKANRQALYILFVIGIVTLIIAVINFTNFSTALAPIRIRNINTQRVMGAQQRTIRWVLVCEAVVFSVMSYSVAILLVKLFGGSELANLVNADLSLAANLPIISGTVLVAIVVGIIAGLYPSRYMTSFAPALVLKGSFGLSPKGKKLRNTLIGIQFMASLILIISASFMYLQNRAMQNAPMGYDTNALVTTNIEVILEHRDAFTHQLKQHSVIEDVTFAGDLLLRCDRFGAWGGHYQGEFFFFTVFSVLYNFLQVMGIEVTEGRDFRREDADMEMNHRGMLIFNETARQRFNLELNTGIDYGVGEIIGFIPDIQFASHRSEMRPMAFIVPAAQQPNQLVQAYIRLAPGANTREAMAHIRSTLAEFDPNYPFEVRFFDEVLQQLYENEIRLSLLITLFSLIAIFISIVGVFGLVVFDSECRRKEIGIRKVMGATTMEIITMFNKSYISILAICFVIAVPVAWLAISRWLENFVYQTPMHWWVFLLAFIAVGAITVLTVTIQNWRVANENPVKSIKTE